MVGKKKGRRSPNNMFPGVCVRFFAVCVSLLLSSCPSLPFPLSFHHFFIFFPSLSHSCTCTFFFTSLSNFFLSLFLSLCFFSSSHLFFLSVSPLSSFFFLPFSHYVTFILISEWGCVGLKVLVGAFHFGLIFLSLLFI
jgi:hypothetical protein